jgi:hypothetical protein
MKGSMNIGDYKSVKSAGSRRKKVTMGPKDKIYREAVKDSPKRKPSTLDNC